MAEAFTHRDRCAIAGIGVTDFSRNSGRSDLTLATQACLAALADAGMTPQDIDGIVRCDSDNTTHNQLAEVLGIPNLTYWGINGPGGTAPSAQVGQAVGAILSGQARNVLVFRSINGRSGVRYGQGHRVRGPELGGDGTGDEFFAPFGCTTPAQMFALMMRKHTLDYGTTAEQLGRIALACRERAHANPNAQMGGRQLTMDDYLNSRWIAEPLRLLDCCLETDGAAAIVVTSVERARDCPKPPAIIRAVAQGSGPDVQGAMMWGAVLRESITSWPTKYVAETLYRRAGLGPADVDVAQLYDCFTPTVLVQFEDFGFCGKGEGGAFAESGAIDMGGALPINTSGGHLSEGYIHGMNHIVEGVRQIRGESTSQVPNVNVSLVTSGNPPACSALMLVRS